MSSTLLQLICGNREVVLIAWTKVTLMVSKQITSGRELKQFTVIVLSDPSSNRQQYSGKLSLLNANSKTDPCQSETQRKPCRLFISSHLNHRNANKV